MSARVVTEKILVGSLNEWKAEAFLEVNWSNLGNRDESWRMAVVSGGEDTRREIEKLFWLQAAETSGFQQMLFASPEKRYRALRTYCLRGRAGQGGDKDRRASKNAGGTVFLQRKKRAVVHSVGTAAENVSRKTFWK